MSPSFAPLPGLLTLGFAAGLIGLLRRAERPPAGLLLALAAAVLALLGPVLFGGAVLLPLDTLRGFVPFRGLPAVDPHGNFLQQDLLTLIAPSLEAVRAALARGEWPLWNHLAGLGVPLLADPQAQAVQPLALLALLLPVPAAAGALAGFRVVLALLFSALLLRRLLADGCRPTIADDRGMAAAGALARRASSDPTEIPATLGALAYALGGFLQLWLGWPLANAAALLPLVLWALLGATGGDGRRERLWLIGGLAALLLAGQPEAILHAMLFSLAFALWRLLLLAGPARRQAATRLAFCGLAAVALAAPALLPAALYLPASERREQLHVRTAEGWVEPAEPGGWGSAAVQRLVPVVAPNAYGNDRFLAYWGAENINEDASGFVGTATLLLALAALAPGAGVRWARGERVLLATALAAVLLVLARPAPWLALQGLLPAFAQSSALHHRILLLADLVLAWAAARGLQAWLERGSGGARAPTRTLVWLALAGTALAGFLVWAYLAHPPPAAGDLLAFRHGWLARQLKFLALAGALLVALARGAAGRPRVPPALRPWLAWALVVAVGLELLFAHRPANPPQPPRLAYPTTPALAAARAAILAAPLGTRLLGLGETTLPANLASVYGLADARVYNPSAPAAAAALSRNLVRALEGEGSGPGGTGEPWGGQPAAAGLLARLAVGVFIAAPGREPPVPAHRVFGDQEAGVWVAETIPPPARFAAEAPAGASARGPVRVLAAQGPRMVLAFSPAPVEREVTVSVAGVAGWRAVAATGEPRTGRAQGALLAIRVAAGTAELALLYRPPGLAAGVVLAAASLAGLLAWLLPPPRERRRAPAGPR